MTRRLLVLALLGFGLVVVPTTTGGAQATTDLVISEVMFNPASAEDDWEWVELANTGGVDIDLAGWVIDDTNSVAHTTANIAGGVVPAGGTAVLFNVDDVSASDFEAAWGTGINLVPVTGWSVLAINNGSATPAERVGLWDSFASYDGDNQSHANAVVSAEVPFNLDDGNASVYLPDLSDQSTFALSVDGVDTPAGGAAYASAAGGGNVGGEVGSPGGSFEAAVPVISEVMFNPASAEDDWEWVELANTGGVDIDLAGWVIDDINSVAHSESNIETGTVPAGGTAVLFNADDLSSGAFEAAWGTGINLVPVTNWSAMTLNNTGDTIGLWDEFGAYVGDQELHANALVSAPVPDIDDGNASVYLPDLADQSTFALSVDGVDTPAGGAAYASAAGGGNVGGEVGSPGGSFEAAVPVISEVMFNPASAEDDWEWVELANTGGVDIDLAGWVIDDINGSAHGDSNIDAGVVPAGGTAVLFNADDLSTGAFEAAWGTGINLVPVTGWSVMALNNGGDTIGLWDDFAAYLGDQATHANALLSVPYPGIGDGNASVYLPDLSDQSSFVLSVDGVGTPAGGAAYTSAAAGGNSGADVGSPGGDLSGGGDPEPVPIYDIQGPGHTSPFLGQAISTSGIVTAVDSNGFYLQDPDGDGDDNTSDAVVVFLNSAPGVSVGDAVDVTGTVTEFQPGGASTNNLTTTQISSPTVTPQGTGSVPAPVVIGGSGRVPPTQVIDNDNFAVFDPTEDGIDFFESLEAMLVTAEDATAVAGTTRFGEIFATVGGTSPTGVSERGTINISPDDFNPERVQIDEDTGILDFAFPNVAPGDQLGDVTGVIGYSFGNFEILPTVDFSAAVVPGGLAPETADPVGDELTVASFNVLNLDPNDADGDADVAAGRFAAVAAIVADNLGAPDVVALQEVQDNSGSANDGVTSADETLQLLVDEIAAAGGPTYEFVDNPFIGNNTSGGQPSGNIRTAFLYNPARVDLVPGSVQAVVDPTAQQTDPANPFFRSRPPLAAAFERDGREVLVVNNHFSSKGGSSPLFGLIQPSVDLQEDPSVNGSLDERQAQAAAVNEFVQPLLDADPDANVVVLGDFNEFEFISPLLALEEDLTNLTNTLPVDERYTFVFEGNSQSLDHILVSPALESGASFDIVHVNAEFPAVASRASDHDPLLVALSAPPQCNGLDATIVGTDAAEVLFGTHGDDVMVALGGGDLVFGFGGNDTICADGGADIVLGGSGADFIDGGPDLDVLFGGSGRDRCTNGEITISCRRS